MVPEGAGGAGSLCWCWEEVRVTGGSLGAAGGGGRAGQPEALVSVFRVTRRRRSSGCRVLSISWVRKRSSFLLWDWHHTLVPRMSQHLPNGRKGIYRGDESQGFERR